MGEGGARGWGVRTTTTLFPHTPHAPAKWFRNSSIRVMNGPISVFFTTRCSLFRPTSTSIEPSGAPSLVMRAATNAASGSFTHTHFSLDSATSANSARRLRISATSRTRSASDLGSAALDPLRATGGGGGAAIARCVCVWRSSLPGCTGWAPTTTAKAGGGAQGRPDGGHTIKSHAGGVCVAVAACVILGGDLLGPVCANNFWDRNLLLFSR